MSAIDDLQRLHEAATPGAWPWHRADWEGGGPSGSDAEAIVALHNAWPAIHRVLVAAREFADRRNKQADTFHQWAELWQALRALDDKEQRT